MRTHKASQKQSSVNNSLVSRPFVVQPKAEERKESPGAQGYESQMPEFTIFNPAGEQSPVQTKLAIGAPGDKYEQEADRTAKLVVQRINTPAIARSTSEPSIQRRGGLEGGEASTDLESAINSARSGGQPLDAGLQAKMSTAMGADFSGVRVHTDAQSDQLNRSIQAKAFTTGQDVFFRQGEYQPGSRGGQELIAHELTHVVQQNGGTVQRSPQLQKLHQGTLATEIQTQKSPSISPDITPMDRGNSIPTIQRYVEFTHPEEGKMQISETWEFFKPAATERELWAKSDNIKLAADIMSLNKEAILTVEKGQERTFLNEKYYRVVVADKLPEADKGKDTEKAKGKKQKAPLELGADEPFDFLIKWLASCEDMGLNDLIQKLLIVENPYPYGSYAFGAFSAIRIQLWKQIGNKENDQGKDAVAPIAEFVKFLNDWRGKINDVNSEGTHKFNFMVTECGGFSKMVMPGKDSTQESAIIGDRMTVSGLGDLPGPWDNHYAAVIMTDGSDKISLESAAGMDKWWFGFYGSRSLDQTFIVKTLLAKLQLGEEQGVDKSTEAIAYVKACLAGDNVAAAQIGVTLGGLKATIDKLLQQAGM